MLKKTHLVIGLALGLYFLPLVTHKLLFIPIVLMASVLPDVDSISSTAGRRMVFRPVQYFFVHRGPLHSYTVCIILSLLLALILPTFALPFFLGYSFHLFADSFTVRGIHPFWPLKSSATGIVKTGSVVDRALYSAFIFVDLFLFVLIFVR